MEDLEAPEPPALSAIGPRAVDYRAWQQIINSEATPTKREIQATFVARRVGLAPIRASIVANLAFGERAS